MILSMKREPKAMPQAPSFVHPDLETFLAPIWKQFGRLESRTAMENYVTGLLLQHPNKNSDTLAEVLADSSEQQLQGMLTAMHWEGDAVNSSSYAARVAEMSVLAIAGYQRSKVGRRSSFNSWAGGSKG